MSSDRKAGPLKHLQVRDVLLDCLTLLLCCDDRRIVQYDRATFGTMVMKLVS